MGSKIDRGSSRADRSSSDLELAGLAWIHSDHANKNRRSRNMLHLAEQQRATYDIFEGTEQIQQLVVSRAISGLHIK